MKVELLRVSEVLWSDNDGDECMCYVLEVRITTGWFWWRRSRDEQFRRETCGDYFCDLESGESVGLGGTLWPDLHDHLGVLFRTWFADQQRKAFKPLPMKELWSADPEIPGANIVRKGPHR